MSESDWTDGENDLIVADYFAMLTDELTDRTYSKAEHRRQLQALLRRGEGSIEFKHQNISAVLLGLGQPWIEGYKPARRFQLSLVDAVLRRLDKEPLWSTPAHGRGGSTGNREDLPPLWIGPSPIHANELPPVD